MLDLSRKQCRLAFFLWLATLVGGVTGSGRASDQSKAGRMQGVVTALEQSGAGIAGSVVTITSPSLSEPLNTITDDEGRFFFPSIPSGRFTLTASKPAYLSMSYGATRPGRNGVSIPVSDGAQIDGVVIALPRGAVVTGQVVDTGGIPIGGLTVGLIRLSAPAGEPPAQAETNDRGAYRVYGLMPGDYLAVAVPRLVGRGSITNASTLDLDSLLGSSRQLSPKPLSAEYGFPPVFWPGQLNASAAQPIALFAGEERNGIDFIVQPVRSSVVSGTAKVEGGISASRVSLSLNRKGPRLPPTWGTEPILRTSDNDLTRFAFSSVTPGEYQLTARARVADGASMADLWATSSVVSLGSDLAVDLVMRPGQEMRGLITFTSIRGQLQRLPVQRILLRAENTDVYSSFGRADETSASGTVDASGRFHITRIRPGKYFFDVVATQIFSGSLRSIKLDGSEVLDRPIVFDGGMGPGSAVLTFSEHRSDLVGTLQRPKELPPSEYDIVVFPSDTNSWQPGSRRIRSDKPGRDGMFEFRDLLPGTYLVAAVTDVRADDLRDRRFLETLMPGAATVRIPDNGITKITLMTAR